MISAPFYLALDSRFMISAAFTVHCFIAELAKAHMVKNFMSIFLSFCVEIKIKGIAISITSIDILEV